MTQTNSMLDHPGPHPLWLVFICALSLDCQAQPPQPTHVSARTNAVATPDMKSNSPDERGCPSVEFIRALHAAAFFLEGGDKENAAIHLEQLEAHPITPSTRTLTDTLQRARATGDTLEFESLRLQFRDWPCLPEDLHEQLHGELPPR